MGLTPAGIIIRLSRNRVLYQQETSRSYSGIGASMQADRQSFRRFTLVRSTEPLTAERAWQKNSSAVLALLVLLSLSCLGNANRLSSTPDEKDMQAYLLVYFQDNTHSLHFALSTDGYAFTAVNNGVPVVAGDTIASQKGVRDPHIARGPDGAFYLAMTDLHLNAQRLGYRTTRWERPQ